MAMGYFIYDARMYNAFGFDEPIIIVGLILAGTLFTPLNAISKFLSNYWTRSMEYQADEFAIKLGHGKGLRSGLLKLGEENKSALNPDWLYATLNFSHPSMVERI